MELLLARLATKGCAMSWREATIKFIKELMKPKTISEVIQKELRESQLRKLEAESAVEYAMSVVQYNDKRINRLQERLAHYEEEEWINESTQKRI
jgi:hypothetical protein